ncbi:MAG: hypothetical protein WA970_19640, partial [Gammaproteobacteria bacterium]
TGRGAQRDRYAVVSAGRQYPVLKCHACGEYPPLKSNRGIAEERERLGAYLGVPPEASCPDVHYQTLFSADRVKPDKFSSC